MSFGADYNIYKDTVDPGGGLKKIIDDEKSRIKLKSDKVNAEYDTKKRQETLLQNQTARSNAYLHMFLTVAITVILSLFCVYLDRFFPGMIPEIVTDLLIKNIIIIGVIYLIVLYIDLQKRDTSDYNKINFGYLLKKPEAPLDLKNGETPTATSVDPASQRPCVGAACCPGGKGLSAGTNKCEAFTPLPEYTVLR
jgi:hypothetical protein